MQIRPAGTFFVWSSSRQLGTSQSLIRIAY